MIDVANQDRLLLLLYAARELGPWLSVALDDPTACEEFKDAADDFLTSLHELENSGL